MGFNYLFIFPPSCVALWGSKAHHRHASESVSWCLETSLFLRLPSQDGAPFLYLCLSFYILYFFLPPFEENGLLFWVPDVLCRHSEVVLWNLLSVQIFFWWICGGESGLPVLFLCHLRTTLTFLFYLSFLSLTIFISFVFIALFPSWYIALVLFSSLCFS